MVMYSLNKVPQVTLNVIVKELADRAIFGVEWGGG